MINFVLRSSEMAVLQENLWLTNLHFLQLNQVKGTKKNNKEDKEVICKEVYHPTCPFQQQITALSYPRFPQNGTTQIKPPFMRLPGKEQKQNCCLPCFGTALRYFTWLALPTCVTNSESHPPLSDPTTPNSGFLQMADHLHGQRHMQ